MHYHVVLRDNPDQIAVLTDHHTYRTETVALDAARRLVGKKAHRSVMHDDTTGWTRIDGSHVYVTACERPACLVPDR